MTYVSQQASPFLIRHGLGQFRHVVANHMDPVFWRSVVNIMDVCIVQLNHRPRLLHLYMWTDRNKRSTNKRSTNRYARCSQGRNANVHAVPEEWCLLLWRRCHGTSSACYSHGTALCYPWRQGYEFGATCASCLAITSTRFQWAAWMFLSYS